MKKILIALIAFIFVACNGSTSKNEQGDPSKPPTWFYKLPKDATHYYVVGYSKGFDEQDVRAQSEKDAVSNVIFLIGVQIKTKKTFADVYREKEGKYIKEKSSDRKVEIAGQGKIKKFTVVEYKKVINPKDKDKIEGYILIKIPKIVVHKAIRDIEKRANYLADNPTVALSYIQVNQNVRESNILSDLINQLYVSKGYYIITTEKDVSKAVNYKSDRKLVKYFKKKLAGEASWVILGLLRVNPHGKLREMPNMKSVTGTFTIKIVDLKKKKIISSKSYDEKGFGRSDDRAIEDMINRIKEKLNPPA